MIYLHSKIDSNLIQNWFAIIERRDNLDSRSSMCEGIVMLAHLTYVATHDGWAGWWLLIAFSICKYKLYLKIFSISLYWCSWNLILVIWDGTKLLYHSNKFSVLSGCLYPRMRWICCICLMDWAFWYDSGESETFLQKAIQQQGRGRILDTINEIQERHDAVKDLENNLKELHQVFMDMAVLVEHQGEQLDDIESHVQRANSYVRGGTQQLQTARKLQRNSRKWTCYAIIILLIIILVVLLSVRPWEKKKWCCLGLICVTYFKATSLAAILFISFILAFHTMNIFFFFFLLRCLLFSALGSWILIFGGHSLADD